MPVSKKVPAKVASKKVAVADAKDKAVRLIDILKTDHNLDIVEYIVGEMGYIQRSKKISPLDKRRLIKDYSLTLLSYCMPKMRVTEDSSDKDAKPMLFQINIGGPQSEESLPASTRKSTTNLTIKTNKNKDGSYSISSDD